MNSLKLFSPSKINLFLRILRKREDGYHNLASLFQAIDLFDSITFKLNEKDHLISSDPFLLMDENNLVVKALKLFREYTEINDPVSIYLEKNIPIEAGLGGGSGNAATTLYGLSSLLGANLTKEELIFLGSKLGSDVPFFFSSGSAYCTSKGEDILDVAPLNHKSYTLVKPNYALSTPKVYSHLDFSKIADIDPRSLLLSHLQNEPQYVNDMEQAAFELEPELFKLKKLLTSLGFETVMLAGSGTCFICTSHKKIEINDPSLKCYHVNSIDRESFSWYEEKQYEVV